MLISPQLLLAYLTNMRLLTSLDAFIRKHVSPLWEDFFVFIKVSGIVTAIQLYTMGRLLTAIFQTLKWL